MWHQKRSETLQDDCFLGGCSTAMLPMPLVMQSQSPTLLVVFLWYCRMPATLQLECFWRDAASKQYRSKPPLPHIDFFLDVAFKEASNAADFDFLGGHGVGGGNIAMLMETMSQTTNATGHFQLFWMWHQRRPTMLQVDCFLGEMQHWRRRKCHQSCCKHGTKKPPMPQIDCYFLDVVLKFQECHMLIILGGGAWHWRRQVTNAADYMETNHQWCRWIFVDMALYEASNATGWLLFEGCGIKAANTEPNHQHHRLTVFSGWSQRRLAMPWTDC